MMPFTVLRLRQACSQPLLFAALLMTTGYLGAEETNGRSLAQQIDAAQGAAEAVQTELSPRGVNSSTSKPSRSSPETGKSKGMAKMNAQKTKGSGGSGAMGGGMGGKMKPETKGLKRAMDAPMEWDGRRMMGRMKGVGKDGALDRLPAFPGNRHLYHMGADNFFIDWADSIGLDETQQAQLMGLQSNWQTRNRQLNGEIDQAEQTLWQLTAEEAPAINDIEATIREVERLKSEQRLTFIRMVGEAASLLTAEQRTALTQSAVALPSEQQP